MNCLAYSIFELLGWTIHYKIILFIYLFWLLFSWILSSSGTLQLLMYFKTFPRHLILESMISSNIKCHIMESQALSWTGSETREDAYSRTGGIFIRDMGTAYGIFIVIQWSIRYVLLHWITMNMPYPVSYEVIQWSKTLWLHWITMNMPYAVPYPRWKCLPYGSTHPPYYLTTRKHFFFYYYHIYNNHTLYLNNYCTCLRFLYVKW